MESCPCSEARVTEGQVEQPLPFVGRDLFRFFRVEDGSNVLLGDLDLHKGLVQPWYHDVPYFRRHGEGNEDEKMSA